MHTLRIWGLSCFLFFMGLVNLPAQQGVQQISLESIHGMSVGSESETLATIRQRAVNEAKVAALQKAGIQEQIQSYSSYFQSESREDFEELFSSGIFTNIRGAVKDVRVVKTRKKFTDEGLPRIEVWIDCKVMKYHTKKDMAFIMEVEGVHSFYQHHDPLEFTVKPHKKGYLRAFVFTAQDAFQIFPNDYESSFQMSAGSSYQFPRNSRLILETQKKSEMHRLVLVYLKENLPYVDGVTYKDILDWIFTIPPDQRTIKTFTFTVVRE